MKDFSLYAALVFFVLSIFMASMSSPVAAVISALGAAMQFLFYKKLL